MKQFVYRLWAELLMITDTEKRAHKRAEVQADFYWQGKPYPLKNISVGGFSLNSKTQIYLPSNSLSGLIVFENDGIRMSLDVGVNKLESQKDVEDRFKFQDLSETQTNLIRTLVMQDSLDDSFRTLGNLNLVLPYKKKSKFLKFRNKILNFTRRFLVAALAMMALLTLILAQPIEVRWITSSHEIISPFSGKLEWARKNKIIGNGTKLTLISSDVSPDIKIENEMTSPVSGRLTRWFYNLGDTVDIGDVIAQVSLVPAPNGIASVFISKPRLLPIISVGSSIVLTNRQGSYIEGTVIALLPRQQVETGIEVSEANNLDANWYLQVDVESLDETHKLLEYWDVSLLRTLFRNLRLWNG